MNKEDKKLLIQIWLEMLEEHGPNISKATAKRVTATNETRTSHQNLGAQGYLTSMNGTTFTFTREGYIAAEAAAHPFRSLLKSNPKWVFTTVVIGIIMPVLVVVLTKLLECSDKEHTQYPHPSEPSLTSSSNKSE